MKPIFQDYLAIFNKFSKVSYLNKTQKAERHQAFLNFDKTTYNDPISIDELMAFIHQYHHDVIIDNPFFFKKITKVLAHDIDIGGTLALKFLTSAEFGYLFGLYAHCYHELYNKDIAFYDLVEKLLIKEPANLYVQEQKYELLYKHIALSIHEVPWIVLFGSDSASIDETHILLKELDEFEQVTKQLQKPKPPIIDEVRLYYLAWMDYLKSTENLNFLTYLQTYHHYQIDE